MSAQPDNVIPFGDKPGAAVVIVTPEIAQRWIGRNDRNRNIRTATVTMYARDMAHGNWQLTGEAIKFDKSGTLLDGQHRLMAVIKSGASVHMLVVRGLESSAQAVMDSGVKRQAADALKLQHGLPRSAFVAATARLALLVESDQKSGVSGLPKFSVTDVVEYVQANPKLLEATADADLLRKNIKVITPSVLAYAYMRLSSVDAAACSDFFEAIANHATNGPGDPRFALLRRLSNARDNRERVSHVDQLGFIFRAWNMWRAGKKVNHLKSRTNVGNKSVKASLPEPK